VRRPLRAAAQGLVLGLASVLAGAGPAIAQGRAPVRVETVVTPDTLRLGEEVTLTWRMWLPRGSAAAFPARPREDSLHHWTAWEASTRELKGAYREHRLVARFQTFALGEVSVPGPPVRFRIPGEETRSGTFPVANLVVVRTVPPDGPEPPLRDLHGLVPPPWWATVPWPWIAAGVLALALLVFLVRRLRRRRPAPAAVVAEGPREAPEVEARRRLDALAARRLPEAGRTYEHGTELADLLRVFVERRFGLANPGDTTGELATRLGARAEVAPADVAALRAILEACDLTKFARRPYDTARAHQAEAIARTLIDRWAAPAVDPGAAAAADAADAKRGAA
jgi:hypothetical protein